jgi:hypothetical protein
VKFFIVCALLFFLGAVAQEPPRLAVSTAAPNDDSAGTPQIRYLEPDIGVVSLPDRKKGTVGDGGPVQGLLSVPLKIDNYSLQFS